MRGALPQPMPMPVPAAVVANAFVQQYFTTRHANPSQIFRFYGANSVAAWPSRFTPWPEAGAPVDGAAPAPLLELNAGLQAIDVKAVALGYDQITSHVHSVDSLYTQGGCILVLTAGVLLSKIHEGAWAIRGFAQTFVLAPQATGGFVVTTDVLRLTSATHSVGAHPPALKPAVSGAMTPASAGGVSSPRGGASSPITPPQDIGQGGHDDAGKHTESSSSPDASESGRLVPAPAPAPVPVPAPMPIPVLWNVDQQTPASPVPEASNLSGRAAWPQVGFSQAYGAALAQVTMAPGSTAGSGGSDAGDASKLSVPASESASIFVRRLPLDVTHADLMEAFSVFGVVRSCVVKTAATRAFAFIDFDTPAAAAAALAARVAIGGALVAVEEKRERIQRPSGFSPTSAMRGISGYPGGSRPGGGRSRAGAGGARVHLGGLMAAPGYGGHQLVWPVYGGGGESHNMYYSPQQYALDQLMAAQQGSMISGGMMPGYAYMQHTPGGEHLSNAHLMMGGGYGGGGGGGGEEAYHIARGVGGGQGGEGGGGVANDPE